MIKIEKPFSQIDVKQYNETADFLNAVRGERAVREGKRNVRQTRIQEHAKARRTQSLQELSSELLKRYEVGARYDAKRHYSDHKNHNNIAGIHRSWESGREAEGKSHIGMSAHYQKKANKSFDKSISRGRQASLARIKLSKKFWDKKKAVKESVGDLREAQTAYPVNKPYNPHRTHSSFKSVPVKAEKTELERDYDGMRKAVKRYNISKLQDKIKRIDTQNDDYLLTTPFTDSRRVNESVELQELSSALLDRYGKKASSNISQNYSKMSEPKRTRRLSGMAGATQRRMNKDYGDRQFDRDNITRKQRKVMDKYKASGNPGTQASNKSRLKAKIARVNKEFDIYDN